MPTIIRCGGGIPVSDYESLQTEYNSYKSSHAHSNDEYNSYGSAQYAAGSAGVLNGSPKSITFSYAGNSSQRTSISAPLITLGHSTATITISIYGYGQVALLGLAKNDSSWVTVKNGNYSGTIDCSGYAALAIQAGGYEPGYGASGSGTISVS